MGEVNEDGKTRKSNAWKEEDIGMEVLRWEGWMKKGRHGRGVAGRGKVNGRRAVGKGSAPRCTRSN